MKPQKTFLIPSWFQKMSECLLQLPLNEKFTQTHRQIRLNETQKKENEIKWKFGTSTLTGLIALLVALGFIVYGEFTFLKSFKHLKSQIKS